MVNKALITSICVILLGLSFSQKANSQVLISILLGDKLNTGKIEFGLTGGYSMTNIIHEPVSKHQNVFFLGFYFDFLLKENLYLYTGVHVKTNMGATGIPVYSLNDPEMDSVFLQGEINRKISYFYLPLELKYKFKSNIFIDLGCQFGLRTKAYDEFTNSVVEDDDLIYKNSIKDQIKRLDTGVSGGMGYKFKKGIGVSVGARYYYGLVNIYKDDSRKGNNSSLYLYVDIPIGAGKKDKDK